MTTKVSANGVSVAPSTIKSDSSNINRYNDLGIVTLENLVYTSNNGLISLKDASSWASNVNLWSPNIDTTLPSGVKFQNQILIDPNRTTNANSLATVQQYLDIPKSLLLTSVGSFDVQFSIQNQYTTNVDSGVPSYLSNFNNTQYSSPLNCGFRLGVAGTNQTSAPSILGNASSIGGNYTVINAQFGSLITDFGTNAGLISPPSPLSGNAARYVRGTVTMTFDAAYAAGLQDNEYNGLKINPYWRGNFKYSVFSALFKIREEYFWDNAGYTNTNGNDEMHYEIQMIPQTSDPDASNYGKYDVTIQVSSTASYNSANIGLRWLATINKFRNFVV